jgi:hypothetical protein
MFSFIKSQNIQNNKKEPINVYYTKDHQISETVDWDFLYPQPKNLFSELIKERKDIKDLDSFLLCPAIVPKFKKILVFRNSIKSSYEYGSDGEKFYIKPTSNEYINMFFTRKETLIDRPTFMSSLSYLFFADSPLSLFFTPPYFHKPEHLQYGACMPGEIDIGQWFRPFNFEFQTWSASGEFHLKDNEPLFYAEFKTDRPILFHRFNLTPELHKYKTANGLSGKIFGPFKTMNEKYERFKQVGYREKILTEIKKNLIDEEPYRF